MSDSGNDTYPTNEDLIQRAEKDPIARSTAQAKRIVTGPMVALPDSEQTSSRVLRKMSGAVLRLARRMGADADELAKKYPDDTLRRTKYPVVEERQEDGTILYKHNVIKS